MKFHNITKDDMLNGDGLRVVLWLSGCIHRCRGCHNRITWSPNNGIDFDKAARDELFEALDKDYTAGITFSGGDPLHKNNIEEVLELILYIRKQYPTKTIWLYSGYTWYQVMDSSKKDDLIRQKILSNLDIFVDGKFEKENKDVNYPWVGSINQRIIDVKETLNRGYMKHYIPYKNIEKEAN
jgi:anaerobic ribonucleoside-triphosphate reductase activating protein